MKRPILCIKKKDFDTLDKLGKIIDLPSTSLHWIERELAETDESYLQLIPYVSIVRVEAANDYSVFKYTRLKGGQEVRLHNNTSIGIGGHIDYTPEYDSMSLEEILIDNMTKELSEELSFWGIVQCISGPVETVLPDDMAKDLFKKALVKNEESIFPYNKFLIFDNSNAVGRVHLGIPIMLMLNYEENTDIIVNKNEEDKLRGCFVRVSDPTFENGFETWSEIMNKYLMKEFNIR